MITAGVTDGGMSEHMGGVGRERERERGDDPGSMYGSGGNGTLGAALSRTREGEEGNAGGGWRTFEFEMLLLV